MKEHTCQKTLIPSYMQKRGNFNAEEYLDRLGVWCGGMGNNTHHGRHD